MFYIPADRFHMHSTYKQKVIFYRDHLLPASETFIRAQGEGLRHFEPHYVGMRPVNGILLPEDRTHLLNNGSAWGYFQEYSLKLGAVPPVLGRAVRSIAPALVHAHFGRDAAHILPLVKRSRLPFFVTFHGWDATVTQDTLNESPSGRRYLRRRHELADTAVRIIAASNFLASCVKRHGFPEDKIYVHYVGVNTAEFVPNPQVPREDVVLFVGRLVEKKGCEYVIRAMEEVQTVNPDIQLVVIGDGPLRGELQSMAGEKLRKFSFLGMQNTSIVRSWMQRAKVFCVPSIVARSGDAEGFGIVFIEAQALGTPVVSFSTGGVPEAVAHGSTGFLAPEHDWRQLAIHIMDLFRNDSLWTQVSHEGVRRVRRSFDLQRQCALLEDLYLGALQQQGMLN
jgi:colanic acid/amylovoran biosynthesis glycosyltransferase